MRLLLCLALIALAACGRPLTQSEATFARDFFGPTLDVSKARVSLLPGVVPPRRPLPEEVTILTGTERACVRTPQPNAEREPPQALALWSSMQFGYDLYSADMALAYPNRVRFPQMLILAHELTHVWQWQNRDRTGYTPWRAALEQLQLGDPYFWIDGDAPVFLAYSFEHQAAMVTDFVCFTASNPDHPRRAELRALLAPVFPVEAFEGAIRGR